MDDDSCCNCCCGCCVGLALGYMLFGCPTNVKAEELTPTHPQSLEQTIIDQETNFLLKQIGNYQRNISPALHDLMGTDKICKFEPSCSEYARDAIIKYGKTKGTIKALGRLARCNPLSKGGYNPLE